jgi:protein-disulfide isomerase
MVKRTIQISMVLIITLLLVSAGVFLYLSSQSRQATPITLPKPVTITTRNQPTLGPLDAKIHIVAFEDFKCINCKRYSLELYPKIKKDFIDTKKAKYTLINLAFIPGSSTAAITAHCLFLQNNLYFFEFADYLYHHQGLETTNWTNLPNMLEYANRITGIDSKKLEACVSNPDSQTIVSKNMLIAQQTMGDTIATPALYINGIQVKPLTYQHFKRIFSAVSQQS